jgi:integrase
MARERTGSVKYLKKLKLYQLRITYVDDLGRRHDLRRNAATVTEARDALKKLKRELEDHGPAIIDGERLIFGHLADTYEKRKLQPAAYKGETRISGMRSWKSARLFLRSLRAFFGKKRVRAITHSDIEKYKSDRLQTPVMGSRKNENGEIERVVVRERSVANVNRELSLLRAILNFAKRSGWIMRNPFEMGESLISVADETRRERILSRKEEEGLLAACGEQRAHLRPLIICAVDTGMRRGEMFKLQWSDVDLKQRLIRVRKTTTKTWESRTIGMTTRLREELERLRQEAPPGDGLVFGIKDNIRKSFASACRLAEIEGLHFHDLRHAATTRMIEAGMPPMKVMKITGHKQIATFLRYLNVDDMNAKDVAAALDTYNEQKPRDQVQAQEQPAESDFIN